ncbi:MAG: hypothetical protein A3I11_08220 [Elusimicrobia bacterium RIFCSPLOWO2_02_FULL_39_32]|nr:MAG: hypothetical protein A3B80_08485 [Elusimicrobia bacterium RIFCSPHIGHO2_02_FULL_39_36]OGR93157.1 MAG: hypothetical protein A3I11_08220 [Elusimicrobia bacterium RIFCSPLOWO2_02_FULL_39_32]
MGFFIGTCLLLMWVGFSIQSTQLSYSINKIEDEIKKEERRLVELEMIKNKLVSLDSLEMLAKEKLGFIFTKEENIIYLPVQNKK